MSEVPFGGCSRIGQDASLGGQSLVGDELAGGTRLSWLRELMSSFMKTLRRWYSTVRGLMNSLRADLRVRQPVAGQPGDLRLLGREHVARLVGAPARGLTRGQELAAGALGERLGPDAG